MYKYEGIGSVHWHMVSKLLPATQDRVFAAVDRGEPGDRIDGLRAAYLKVRAGLGLRKAPGAFGAVPDEPYSHTPWGGGAQQPGMTGQVKEGVLARLGELGVRLVAGELRFEFHLFDRHELLATPASWRVRGVLDQSTELAAGSLGFTVCGTPFVISAGDATRVGLVLDDGEVVDLASGSLGTDWTAEITARTGRVVQVRVQAALPMHRTPPSALRSR